MGVLGEDESKNAVVSRVVITETNEVMDNLRKNLERNYPALPSKEIIEGGEIRIQAEFECDEIELQERQASNRVTLCRCGLSNNKPFCDGRHRKKDDFK